MKKNFKRLAIGLLSLCMVATSCGALVACGEAVKLPDYEFDYSKPVEDFGDGIKIDGKPDEALYSEGRAIETAIRGTNAEYKMMTYFGENGVYFGWDIKDDQVAYHPSREIFGNSGIELVVGPLDKSISYEIDLNACGKRMLRKWMGSNFLNWFGDLHSAVVVNGELNGATEGYTAELYLPYHLFNTDGSDTKHETLLVNPIFIRGYQNADSNDKLWYSIGEKERNLGWGAVQDNYYRFSKGVGLEANDVSLRSGEHGKLEGGNYVINGDKYTVTVSADEGYYLEELLFAGKNVTDKLEYSGGVATYTGVVQTNGTLEVSASFAQLPTEKHTLSGKVTAETALSNSRLYAVYSGAFKEIPIGADGSYSVELAAVEWTVYCSADGLLTDYEDVDLSDGDATHDIRLVSDYLQPDNAAFWNFEQLGRGSVYLPDSGWLTAAMHKNLQGTKLFASANLVVKQANDDVRAGFVFQAENGLRIFVMINAQKSDRSYGIQFINNKGVDGWGEWEIADIKITTPEAQALLESTGMPMAVLYDGGKISVWLNGVFAGTNTMKADSANNYGFTEDTEVVPGIAVCSKDTEFHHLTFNTTGFEDGNPITLSKVGKGTVSVEGGNTYTPGQKVRIHVTPKNGFACTGLTVNGKDCLSELSGGVLEYTPAENVEMLTVNATFTRAQNKVSGVVTANGTAVQGVEVRLTGADGQSLIEITDAEGKFMFDGSVMGGQYTLTVNSVESEHYNDQYTSYVQSVRIDEDKEFEITLDVLADLDPKDVYILDGDKSMYNIEGFSLEGLEFLSDGKHVGNNVSGGKITYTYDGAVDPNANHEIKTALRAEANDDFWLSANFRKQESFAMDKPQRYGFVLRSSGWWIGATVIRNPSGAMEFQLYHDWSGDGVSYWKSYTFDANDKAAWESAEGISVAVARINKTYHVYLLRDSVWVHVYETADYSGDGARQVDVSVQIHTPNKGAELRDFTWIRGDIPVNVNVTKHDNVSVTTERQDYALGDTVKLIFKPSEGKYPQSVKIDGVEKVSSLTQNDENDWVLAVENYIAKRTMQVEAVFGEKVVLAEVTLDLTLHKLGTGEKNRSRFANGTTVTLEGAATYTAQVQDGKAVFSMVDGGSYTMKIAGCVDQTVELGTDKHDLALTVEFKTLASADENFVTTEINDGKMTVKGEDGKKAIFTQTANSDEDFYYSAVISNVDLTNGDGGRIGFWIACDRDGNGLWAGDIWGGISEALYTCLRLHGGENTIKFEWPQSNTWEKYTLTDGQRDAMTSDKGLRVGFARVQGKYYVVAANAEGTAMELYLYDGDNWAFNDVAEGRPMQLGFFTAAGRGKAKVCDFSDMQFVIVKNGQLFGDALVDKAFEVDVKNDLTGATLTVEPNARYGNFVLRMTPEEGKIPTQFLVNSENKLAELVERDGNDWLYRVNGYFTSELILEGKFEANDKAEVNVSYKVDLHRLGVGKGNRSPISADNKPVLKQGETVLQPASVTDGIVTFNSVPKGSYTLEAEGYEPLPVDIVCAFTNRAVELQYKLLATDSERFDTSHINDGKLTFTPGGDSKIIFTDTANSDENFLITMNVSGLKMPIGTPDVRFGFWIGCDRDDVPNGLWDGMWGAVNETLYTAFRLNGTESTGSPNRKGGIAVEWIKTNNWEKYPFSAEQVEAIKGSGLTIGFGRFNDKYYVLIGNASGEGFALYRYDADNWAFNDVKEGRPMQIGIFTSYGTNAGQTGNLAEITDLRLNIAKKGSAEEKELFGVKIEKKLGEGVTLTTDPAMPILGGDITLKLTATGVPIKFMVNGEDKLGELSSEGNAFIFRLSAYSRDVLSVEAEFSEKALADVNVTLDLTLHKLGLGEGNRSKFVTNTNVKLVGLYTYDGNVIDGGKVGFTGVKEGKYTLKIEGCLDQEVEIKANSSEMSLTVEYNMVLAAGENFETSNINDGEAKYVGTENESHMKLALESGTGDFYFAAVIKHDIPMLSKGTEGFRYGFTVFSNQSGLNDIHFTLIGVGDDIAYAANEWKDVWQQQNLSDTIKAAWNGDGITLAVVRRGGTFYALVKAGTTWSKAFEFNHTAYASINLNMGLAGWKDITTGATFKNITFQNSVPEEVKTLVGVGE